jgi:hypothetical protein
MEAAMDKHDDTKHNHSDVDDVPARQGDILGLGGSVVPKAPGDPTTEYDDASIARRRARANTPDPQTDTTPSPTPGATGIDMGAGGTGTDIE